MDPKAFIVVNTCNQVKCQVKFPLGKYYIHFLTLLIHTHLLIFILKNVHDKYTPRTMTSSSSNLTALFASCPQSHMLEHGAVLLFHSR